MGKRFFPMKIRHLFCIETFMVNITTIKAKETDIILKTIPPINSLSFLN